MKFKTILMAAVPVIVGVVLADFLSAKISLLSNTRSGQIKS